MSGNTIPAYLNDVQTGVVRGLNAQIVGYLFFRIVDRAAFVAGLPDGPDAGEGNGLGLTAGVFRSEAWRLTPEPNAPDEKGKARLESDAQGAPLDPDPPSFIPYANVAFTHGGLKALGVNDATLATFPEPFRAGMAQRAPLLGDCDADAPVHWDGYLGSREIHGVAWTSFQYPPQAELIGIDTWYRALISAVFGTFQVPVPLSDLPPWEPDEAGSGKKPPFGTGLIAGADVIHIEFGMANYGSSDPTQRIEHFGFRDGISQPYANIGLAPPPPGGGTAKPGGSWAPVAMGELLLGHPDEDGRVQQLPANVALRTNGTYMVFRKLRQDVFGLRNFMARHDRTGVADGLAAQMVGRWPDGSSLVLSPHGPACVPVGGAPKTVNDFRYQADDPAGIRCPISAHIRRANPRDTNNRDEARRHRLFRRSMSYGGGILGAQDDGIERGLLFISMQARLDRQFEHVQANWLGRGELAGQAGAHRDPLLAGHAGRTQDAFQHAGCPAPVTSLPRFVTTRGGDYFFVPAYSVLQSLKTGENFPIDDTTAPLPENALGAIEPSRTDDLAPRLVRIGFDLLNAGRPPFAPAPSLQTTPFPGGPPMTINTIVVGRWDYVTEVLGKDADYSNLIFDQHSTAITGGQRLLIGLPANHPERVKRLQVLHDALALLPSPLPVDSGVEAATRSVLDRVGPTGALDVVADLGRVVPIIAAGALFGVTGPGFVSPSSIAAAFGRIDVTDLPDDWLLALPPIEDCAKPLAAMQTWTRLSFLQIFVNIGQAQDLTGLAERAAREMLRHIDSLILRARTTATTAPPRTLIEALVRLPLDPADLPDPGRHIRLLLTEFTVGSVETINAALTNAIDQLLTLKAHVIEVLTAYLGGRVTTAHPTLADLIGLLTPAETDRLIFELLRFEPMGPLAFRTCVRPNATIGGEPVAPGTTVALASQAAMMDSRIFPLPDKIRLDRPLGNYLHFGMGLHRCAGEYEIPMASTMLRIMFTAIATRPRLRRAAGAAGSRQNVFPLLADGLTVRFDPT